MTTQQPIKGLRTLTAPGPGDEVDAISAPKTAMKSEGFVVGWEKGSREGERNPAGMHPKKGKKKPNGDHTIPNLRAPIKGAVEKRERERDKNKSRAGGAV